MKTNIFKPKNLLLIFWQHHHGIGNCHVCSSQQPDDRRYHWSFSDRRSLSESADLCICIYFNCIMFLLGAIILGIDFALTTLISTFYYPIALGFFQSLPALSDITDDRLLSSIFGGLFIGFSLGIVIRAGASTGGMDIPPLILNKKFGLPVSVMLYVFDFIILIGQALFSDKEAILYGILLVLTYTIVLDKILVIGQAQTQVKIISQELRGDQRSHHTKNGSRLYPAPYRNRLSAHQTEYDPDGDLQPGTFQTQSAGHGNRSLPHLWSSEKSMKCTEKDLHCQRNMNYPSKFSSKKRIQTS